MKTHKVIAEKNKATILCIFVLLVNPFWFTGCASPTKPLSAPETLPTSAKFDFKGALAHLQKINAALGEEDVKLASALMKVSRNFFNDKGLGLQKEWEAILEALQGQSLTHEAYSFPLDTQIARGVTRKDEPSLRIELNKDGTSFKANHEAMIDKIYMESFWQHASFDDYTRLYTGAVIVWHENTIVAILEFNNERVKKKNIDVTSGRDLAHTVSNMPGYVSSLGRLAAYARLDLGRKMFNEFFSYARAHNIAESYLHVRHDNVSAIALYESVGYQEIGRVPNYYFADPRANGIVMRKKF